MGPELLARAFQMEMDGLAIFLLIFVSVTLFAFLKTPVYTAKGSIWIENEPNILPFQDVLTFESGSYLQSQSRLLQSRALAISTIEKLKLYENSHFAANLAKGKKPHDMSDPIFKERLTEKFLKKIFVESIQGTTLVEVRFMDQDPRFAAETLNALFDGYVDMLIQQRYQATEQATEFLNTQIASVRTEIADNEKKLNQYGSEKDILPLTASEAPTVSKLADVNKALTDATLDRINKYNYYSQIKSAALGDIPEAMNNALVQRLREQYSTLSREYAKRLATVRPEYPEMQRLRSELDSAKGALQAETENMISAASADYQAALRKEASLRGFVDEQKKEAFKVNSNSIMYNSIKIELENKKTLLESLLKRRSETDVSSRLKGLKASNVWVVDRANYPLRPTSPNRKLLVVIGFLLGLAGALGASFVIEHLGDAVRTTREVTTFTGLPILGTIPSFETGTNAKTPHTEFARLFKLIQGEDGLRRSSSPGHASWIRKLLHKEKDQGNPPEAAPRNEIELIAHREPESIQAESFRSIRTTLLVSSPPGKIKSILFTSPLAREGKSSTVSNLAVTLAQAGKRVVIVDSDLRKPKQNKIFEVNQGSGLTQYLSSHIDWTEVVKATSFPNLLIIESGPIPSNPIELLTSDKMDDLVSFLKRNFDYVLFDAPPILIVSDAIALGPMIDGIILVARGGRTPVQALRQAKQKLDAHKLKCLGVILNSVDPVEMDGYYARQYYQYYQK